MRSCVTLIRGFTKPTDGLLIVRRYTLSCCIHAAKIQLRNRIATRRLCRELHKCRRVVSAFACCDAFCETRSCHVKRYDQQYQTRDDVARQWCA